jgi:hypothetical protein
MYVEVEVVDTPLDYNLLLGRSWTYAMTTCHIFGLSELFVFLMKEKL